MTTFIKVHDLNDGMTMLLNLDDISRVEGRNVGSVVYLRQTADDFDRTRHQVSVYVQEDIQYFTLNLDTVRIFAAPKDKKDEKGN